VSRFGARRWLFTVHQCDYIHLSVSKGSQDRRILCWAITRYGHGVRQRHGDRAGHSYQGHVSQPTNGAARTNVASTLHVALCAMDHPAQLTFSVLNLAMIVFSALVAWKGLMLITNSDSPIVVVLRYVHQRCGGSLPPVHCSASRHLCAPQRFYGASLSTRRHPHPEQQPT